MHFLWRKFYYLFSVSVAALLIEPNFFLVTIITVFAMLKLSLLDHLKPSLFRHLCLFNTAPG